MSRRCIFCDNLIIQKGCPESNDSLEHIILNAIGGMKKVRGFICIKCNSNYGYESDQELAKALNLWCVIFGIKRDRNEVRPEIIKTTKGEQYRLHPDGRLEEVHIKFTKEEIEGVLKKISISARNEKEAQKKIEELRKKYPKMQMDEMVNMRSYLENPVKYDIDLNLSKTGASVIKSLITLMAGADKSLEFCQKIIDGIKTKEPPKVLPNIWFFYENDIVKNRSNEQIFHCVSVYGDSKNSKIIGYVEYFSFWRAAVILSEDYSGEEFSETYAIDPKSGLEINLDVDLKSNTSQIVDVVSNRKINDLILKEALVNLMKKARKADYENQVKIISKDIDEKAKNLRFTNPNPPDEDLMKIANYGANEFVSMLQRGGFIK
jgi:hypothetical protein